MKTLISHTLTPSCPQVPPTDTDTCVCDSLCHCTAGLPKGLALLPLYLQGIANAEGELKILPRSKRNAKRVASLERRVRQTRLLIMTEELKAAIRSEMANSATLAEGC